jgi:pyruvate,orthophosphate dikinase
MPEASPSSSRSIRPREALPRHAGHRVHHPGRQALHAPVPQRGRTAAPRCASPSRWRGRGSSPGRGRAPRRALEARRAPPPDARPGRPPEVLARASRRAPARPRARSCSRRRGRERWRPRARPGDPGARETSPEDIHGMKAASGILTSRGGATSHAAVVARGMGKCCVAGCSALHVDYETKTMTVSRLRRGRAPRETGRAQGGRPHHARRRARGEVYLGEVPMVPALDRRVRRADAWADEVRTPPVRANADTPSTPAAPASFGAEGIGLCRTEHMFFDEARIHAMREMILADLRPRAGGRAREAPPLPAEDFVGIFRAMAASPSPSACSTRRSTSSCRTDDAQFAQLAKRSPIVPEAELRRARQAPRVQPHARPPRRAPRGHLPRDLRHAGPRHLRGRLRRRGHARASRCLPEIMIPLAMAAPSSTTASALVDQIAAEVFAAATGRSGPTPTAR